MTQVFRKPAITSNHAPLATPPLYMTHPLPRAQVSCVKFIPHRDLLTIGHANGISTIIIPGASNPHYDTAEGGDPYEGKQGRREREVRALLEKLEPSTIVMDPEMLGGMAEEGKILDVVHRKLPRMDRLRQTGKADETEIVDAEAETDVEPADGEGDLIDGVTPKHLREKRKKKKMRGKDKSMKRYLKKKRKNVIDQATVRILSYKSYGPFSYLSNGFTRLLSERSLTSRRKRSKRSRMLLQRELQENRKYPKKGLH